MNAASDPLPPARRKPFQPLLDLLVAVQFLTLSPAWIKRAFTPQELGRSVGYFPLVGAWIGALLLGAGWLSGLVFPDSVRSALILAVWVGLTGALHVDGFLDACDGLLGGFTPESRLEIMRDERVGGFALAGGVLLFLLKFTAVLALPGLYPALLLAPVLGRWVMGLAMARYPYARPQGLGKSMKENIQPAQVVLATSIALLAAGFAAGWLGLAACAVSLAVGWVGARFTLRRIPGLTGDIYGALCELVETVVLLFFVAASGQGWLL